jgi:hypothetical protein
MDGAWLVSALDSSPLLARGTFASELEVHGHGELRYVSISAIVKFRVGRNEVLYGTP